VYTSSRVIKIKGGDVYKTELPGLQGLQVSKGGELMKKFILGALSLAVIACILLAGCGDGTETTQTTTKAPAQTTTKTSAATTTTTTTTTSTATEPVTIKLTFASEKPSTHFDQTDNFPGFFKMVEEATNGKYKLDVEYFPVNTLLEPAGIYDGVASGVVDAGQSSSAYTSQRFPLLLTLSQPGIAPPKSAQAMAKAAMELYNKYQPEEFADTHILYFYPTGPGWMHANEAITTVEQMKNKKIRVSGVGVRAIELIGGDPIAMPMGDVYESAQKGIIDFLVSPAETLEGWKHAELFKYSTFVPYIYSSDIFFVTMNLDKWNSLPADLQAAFESVAIDGAVRAGAMWQYQHTHAMEYAKAQPGGHEDITLSEVEANKLIELLKPIRDEYVAFLDSKGLPGEEIAAEATRIVAEANALEYEPWQP